MQLTGWFAFVYLAALVEFGPPYGRTNRALAHLVLGNVVTALGVLQPVNAIFRPHHGEQWRWHWELMHKSMGWLALLLSMPTIVIGILLLEDQSGSYFPTIGVGCFVAYASVCGLLVAVAAAALLSKRPGSHSTAPVESPPELRTHPLLE